MGAGVIVPIGYVPTVEREEENLVRFRDEWPRSQDT